MSPIRQSKKKFTSQNHKIQRLELNLDVGMSLRIVISITECNSNISNKFIPNFEDYDRVYQFVINIYSFKINTFIILFSIVSLNLGQIHQI